jgi:hypothetical protein
LHFFSMRVHLWCTSGARLVRACVARV